MGSVSFTGAKSTKGRSLNVSRKKARYLKTNSMERQSATQTIAAAFAFFGDDSLYFSMRKPLTQPVSAPTSGSIRAR